MLKWPVFPCNCLFGGVSILGIIGCMYISVHVHVEQDLSLNLSILKIYVDIPNCYLYTSNRCPLYSKYSDIQFVLEYTQIALINRFVVNYNCPTCLRIGLPCTVSCKLNSSVY